MNRSRPTASTSSPLLGTAPRRSASMTSRRRRAETSGVMASRSNCSTSSGTSSLTVVPVRVDGEHRVALDLQQPAQRGDGAGIRCAGMPAWAARVSRVARPLPAISVPSSAADPLVGQRRPGAAPLGVDRAGEQRGPPGRVGRGAGVAAAAGTGAGATRSNRASSCADGPSVVGVRAGPAPVAARRCGRWRGQRLHATSPGWRPARRPSRARRPRRRR